MPARLLLEVPSTLHHSRTKLQHSAFFSTDGGSEVTKKQRRDPTAKRPNKLCDPYGQGGKPLTMLEVQQLLPTIQPDWQVEEESDRPMAILRLFDHPDFVSGARFAARIAAVAQMNAHYPTITLDRRIRRQQWHVVTAVRCHTLVLGGLSTHDFHLAMLVDVEADRPYVRPLLIDQEPIPP